MKQLILVTAVFAIAVTPLRSQWKPLVAGSGKIPAFGIHDTHLFVAIGSETVYRYDDTAMYKWDYADNGIAADAKGKVLCFGSFGDYLFAGTDGDPGLYRTKDEGASWEPLTHMAGSIGKSIASSGNLLFVSDERGVNRSTDSGTSWTYPVGGRLSSVAALGPAIVAVGDGVLRSTDFGVTWSAVNSGLSGLRAMTTLEGELVTCSEYGLYRSSDSGATWVQMNYNWTAGNTCLVASGPNLFVGTDDAGIFLTTDKGLSWTPVNQGLPFLVITTLAVYDTLLLAGIWTTNSNGTSEGWKRPLPQMLTKSAVRSSNNPAVFDRVMIYPNPAERSAVVEYSLQDETKVDLGLFDVMGREISVLLSQSEQGAGLHRFELDVSHIPPGAYWVHLRTNNKERVDRIILMR